MAKTELAIVILLLLVIIRKVDMCKSLHYFMANLIIAAFSPIKFAKNGDTIFATFHSPPWGPTLNNYSGIKNLLW